jgi:hypothetical protein
LHKNRDEDQWNRLNPHSYSHLIFDKGTQNVCWRKDWLFNKCITNENWILMCRRLKLPLSLALY